MTQLVIEPRSDPLPEFRTQGCARLMAVYRKLQEATNEIVPPRQSLELRLIPEVAPFLAIFQMPTPDSLHVRLVGMSYVHRTGVDNTGQDGLEALPPEMRAWTLNHFRRVLETPCGSRMVSLEKYGPAQIPVEVLALPFTNGQGVRNIVISAAVPFEMPQTIIAPSPMQIAGFSEVVYFDL